MVNITRVSGSDTYRLMVFVTITEPHELDKFKDSLHRYIQFDCKDNAIGGILSEVFKTENPNEIILLFADYGFTVYTSDNDVSVTYPLEFLKRW